MIFVSKNEDGVPAWKLIEAGKKTVTRRLKPEIPGKVRAVCPGRGKKAVGYIRIISCVPDEDFCNELPVTELDIEAQREGFKTWESLWECIRMLHHCGESPLPALFRIEFEKSPKKDERSES